MSIQSQVPTILRRKQVESRTGLARSTIYDLVRVKSFPPPIKLGCKSVGWIEGEIDAWIKDRITDSRKNGGKKC